MIPATSAKNMRQRPEVRRQALPERAILISMEERRREPVETLKPREVTLGSGAPVLNDLIPVGKSDLLYAENKEIPISDYLTAKLQVLKAEEKKQFFSREELKIFGLRLF